VAGTRERRFVDDIMKRERPCMKGRHTTREGGTGAGCAGVGAHRVLTRVSSRPRGDGRSGGAFDRGSTIPRRCI
jgi:hypothetical protein